MSLADLIVPAKALRWDWLRPMTVESYDWHVDSMRYAWTVTQRQVGARLLPTVTKLLPTVTKLADVLGRLGQDDQP